MEYASNASNSEESPKQVIDSENNSKEKQKSSQKRSYDMEENSKGERSDKKPKIDRPRHMIPFHFDRKINMFLSFRRHIACINRFNLYIHSLKIQYEKNIYLRVKAGNEYDIFLPVPQEPNNHWLLRAVYESIINENIVIQNFDNLILNQTSVYEDHLKRIIKNDNTDIQAWFENSKRSSDEVRKRTLHNTLKATTKNLVTLMFNPLQYSLIKKESGK